MDTKRRATVKDWSVESLPVLPSGRDLCSWIDGLVCATQPTSQSTWHWRTCSSSSRQSASTKSRCMIRFPDLLCNPGRFIRPSHQSVSCDFVPSVFHPLFGILPFPLPTNLPGVGFRSRNAAQTASCLSTILRLVYRTSFKLYGHAVKLLWKFYFWLVFVNQTLLSAPLHCRTISALSVDRNAFSISNNLLPQLIKVYIAFLVTDLVVWMLCSHDSCACIHNIQSSPWKP